MPGPTPRPTPASRWPTPRGTVALTVERVEADRHTRGGTRVPVGRVPPEGLDALLAEQEPGRFRVSCLDACGRFIRRGAYAVEIDPETREPRIVPARTSRDYGERSPASVARQKERAAVERAETLRQQVRRLGEENARLRHEAALGEAARLQEQLRDGTERARMSDELGRLAREMHELRDEMARRHHEMRCEIDSLRAELAAGPGPRTSDSASAVAAVPATFPASDVGGMERERPGSEVGATRAANEVSAGAMDLRIPGRPLGENGASRGLAALAAVRNVGSGPPASKRSPSAEPEAPRGDAPEVESTFRRDGARRE